MEKKNSKCPSLQFIGYYFHHLSSSNLQLLKPIISSLFIKSNHRASPSSRLCLSLLAAICPIVNHDRVEIATFMNHNHTCSFILLRLVTALLPFFDSCFCYITFTYLMDVFESENSDQSLCVRGSRWIQKQKMMMIQLLNSIQQQQFGGVFVVVLLP